MEACQQNARMSGRGVVGRLSAVRSLVVLAFAGVLAAGLGGCNAGGNNLLEANRALNERVTALTAQNDALQHTNQQLQEALAARDKAISELQVMMNDARAGDTNALARLRELEDRLRNMKFGNLDAATDAALRALADQHPDLIEYVPELGLLRFKSDFTFSSGSDQITSSARSTLEALANILNGAAAAYDVKVQGHTDAQPIVRVKNQHPTNMHLSAHRAISVRNELVNMGVAPQRFEVAGRGEFDPIEANGSDGKSTRNRRVEVYLMRASGRAVATPTMDSTPAPVRAAPTPAPARRSEEIMK